MVGLLMRLMTLVFLTWAGFWFLIVFFSTIEIWKPMVLISAIFVYRWGRQQIIDRRSGIRG